MTQDDNQNRGLAATWVAIALAFAIPLAVLLGFMRGLTSVWRAKWASHRRRRLSLRPRPAVAR